MTYRVTMPNGTTQTVADPNFVKMNTKYPSFICCGYEDAECIILAEGEEQKQYNVNVPHYSDYDTVICAKM